MSGKSDKPAFISHKMMGKTRYHISNAACPPSRQELSDMLSASDIAVWFQDNNEA